MPSFFPRARNAFRRFRSRLGFRSGRGFRPSAAFRAPRSVPYGRDYRFQRGERSQMPIRSPNRGPELKMRSMTQTAGSVTVGSTAVTMQLVNGIPQGTTAGQRVGDRCFLKAFHTKSIFWVDGTTSGGVSYPVRSILILDKSPNGVQAGFTDIFANVATDQVTTTELLEANRYRFNILHDETFVLSLNYAVGQVYTTKKFFKKLNFQTDYVNTASTIASVGAPALWWINVAPSAIANAVNHTFNARLWYTDA